MAPAIELKAGTIHFSNDALGKMHRRSAVAGAPERNGHAQEVARTRSLSRAHYRPMQDHNSLEGFRHHFLSHTSRSHCKSERVLGFQAMNDAAAAIQSRPSGLIIVSGASRRHFRTFGDANAGNSARFRGNRSSGRNIACRTNGIGGFSDWSR